MKRPILLILAAMATSFASAQTQAVIKIGFVNTLEVLYGTEEGKQEIAKVEEFVTMKQQEYDTKETELQRLQEQFANQQRTLNPQTRGEMERTIGERDVELKRLQEDIQLEINRRRDELLGRMSEKIQKIINDYAEKNDFGAILLRDQTQAYVAPGLDVTQDIIRLYNESNASASASSTAPSTGSAPAGASSSPPSPAGTPQQR
ncbi:MAG: OmpH family outer membrane protein [Acidobacteriota bacterium]